MISPSHYHKWLRQNFSLQYQYNIKQVGDENREEYKFKWNFVELSVQITAPAIKIDSNAPLNFFCKRQNRQMWLSTNLQVLKTLTL